MRNFGVADNSKILLRNKCSFLRFYPFIQLEGYENMKANDQNAFIRVPKMLIYGDKYRFLSVHAKLLYALMADRASLSLTNEWIDRNGRVFIYFTIREICETLLCAHDKACRILTELEEFRLIERQKQGQGNPTMIYVFPVETSENQNS